VTEFHFSNILNFPDKVPSTEQQFGHLEKSTNKKQELTSLYGKNCKKQLNYTWFILSKKVYIQVCNIHRQIQDIKKPMNLVARMLKQFEEIKTKNGLKKATNHISDTNYELIRKTTQHHAKHSMTRK
jgi:hypothetical protein